MISFCRQNNIHIKCEINLLKLLTDSERRQFEEKWPEFLASDPCNGKIYHRKDRKVRERGQRPLKFTHC